MWRGSTGRIGRSRTIDFRIEKVSPNHPLLGLRRSPFENYHIVGKFHPVMLHTGPNHAIWLRGFCVKTPQSYGHVIRSHFQRPIHGGPAVGTKVICQIPPTVSFASVLLSVSADLHINFLKKRTGPKRCACLFLAGFAVTNQRKIGICQSDQLNRATLTTCPMLCHSLLPTLRKRLQALHAKIHPDHGLFIRHRL